MLRSSACHTEDAEGYRTPLLRIPHMLSSVCCLPSTVCCLLSAVCCLLSAVCCLLPAVHCFEGRSWRELLDLVRFREIGIDYARILKEANYGHKDHTG